MEINSNFMSENSSINEKKKKLYLKLNSLINSAENFETLKLYEDSLKLFQDASHLAKSLNKKHLGDENGIKNFLNFFDSHIKSKIKTLEQMILIKNTFVDKNVNENKIELNSQIEASILSKMNNTTIPLSSMKIPAPQKEDVLNSVNNLMKNCEGNLKELEMIKKSQDFNNKSILLNTSFINQSSFYIPDGNLVKNNLKSSTTQIENSMLLEKIEEKFRAIYFKLNKLKTLYESENLLKEKKENKQNKLEKLKSAYSAMKKIYENATRNCVKLK